MAKCNNCRVEVLDETEICPLCRSILEQNEPMENMYPNVRVKMQRMKLCSRIYLFCALLLEAVLFSINLLTESGIWWSAITGAVLLYGYLILRYAIVGKAGYRSKTIVLATWAIIAAVLIDFSSGYRGWSVDYVLPGGILLVDIFVLGSMFFNRRNWQSYIMWQILMILCSLIPMTLYLMELEQNPYLAFSPLAVSSTIFLGSVIIGERRAYTELKRRFHI